MQKACLNLSVKESNDVAAYLGRSEETCLTMYLSMSLGGSLKKKGVLGPGSK